MAAKKIVKFYATWCGPCKIYGKTWDKVIPDYKDQIDFYPNLIEDYSKIFFDNTNYRSRFGLCFKSSSLEYELDSIYKNVALPPLI